MVDIERRIINWLIIAFFGVIDFILIPVVICHFFPEEMKIIFGKIKLGDMDLLAFVAGLLTLWGVRITIKNQERREFINSYPEQRKLGDELKDRLDRDITHLRGALDDRKYGLVDLTLGSLKGNDLIEISSKISGGAYSAIRYLVKVAEEWLILHEQGRREHIKNMYQFHLEHHDEYEGFLSKINSYKEQYEQEFHTLTKQFDKLTRL